MGPRVQGGVEVRALQRYLGPDPHLGMLEIVSQRGIARVLPCFQRVSRKYR